MAPDAPPAEPGGFHRPAGLEDYLIYQLHGLTRAATAGIDLCLRREVGVGRRDWRALAVLARADGMPLTAFAERAGLDKVVASRLIASLVERGLVSRIRLDSDRRVARLALTEQGWRAHAEARRVTADYNVRLAQIMSAAEAEQLRALLPRLTAHARDLHLAQRAQGAGPVARAATPADPLQAWWDEPPA
ncbi:MarR family transcriptional regulator [Verticiella sediminum]|uniref:MarR family transcriptional regulator n=1 Tax=Verticiella sediminum TaxID=1247510 RepID=A0A556A953_9BURK|nr:MarR family transcriptional regulator [Verticiella sediminum]TSH89413.1 MarR family transcriptional regulator [Verticiella sediminum]